MARVHDDAYEIVDGMGFGDKPKPLPFAAPMQEPDPWRPERADQLRILAAADDLIARVRRDDCPIGWSILLRRALGDVDA